VPGPVRPLPALPALPRQRHRDREAVREVQRLRSRAPAAHVHREDQAGSQGRNEDPAQGEGRSRPERRPQRRPDRRHPRGGFGHVRAARRRPDRAGPGLLPDGGARRQGRGVDAGGGGVAQDSRGVGGRQAPADQRPRCAEAVRLRQGRRARARPDPGAEAGEQEGARAPRGAAEGGRLMDISERPIYMISVAAELVGMHPQTLRMYETKGLVRPQRTPGGTRLYSEADIERLRIVQRLTSELGLNRAGVELVLRLWDELRTVRAQAEATLAQKPRIEGSQQQPGVSSAFSKVLDRAFDEAKKLEDEYVASQHLLLALDPFAEKGVPRDQLLAKIAEVTAGRRVT